MTKWVCDVVPAVCKVIRVQMTDSGEFLENCVNLGQQRFGYLESGKLDQVAKKIKSSVVIMCCSQELVMHRHASSHHEFKRVNEEVVEFMFSYIGEATKKAKVLVCSYVLGCLKARYCCFNLKFILANINH